MVSNGSTWTSSSTLNGTYIFSGSNNFFTNSINVNGGTTTTSLGLSAAAINFYNAATVGTNVNTSVFFTATGSPIANQYYGFSFNNSGSPAYAYAFYGDGTAQKTGGGSWGTISDLRLKDNVIPLTGALSKINSLNPVSYKWKISNSEPTVGFIAQEVQKILPNAVTTRLPTKNESNFITDETMNIGWQNDMFAYLVGAIKELTAEIEKLKNDKL
jgi:hypothetical protein